MITQLKKKFSTAAIFISLTMWGLLPVGQGEQAFAQTASDNPSNSGAYSSASSVNAQHVFVADAPDHHVVVRGDTLWGIAAKYLTTPWRWPEVWQMNREQIRNPHWIYPGQVIVLDKVHGTMHLAGSGGESGNTVYLHPTVRVEQEHTAIPSIPQDVIAPFLAKPLVVDSAAMLSAPRIIAAKGDRVVLGRGDEAYVAGITDPSIKSYQIFRRGIPLTDPDSGELLGYQANYLGVAQVVHAGDPATILITSFTEEINIGDRLIPSAQPVLVNYVPHAPTQPIHGRIINTYAAVGLAGRDMVVSLNRGTNDGLEIGNVLAVHTKGRVINDTTNGAPHTYTLPDERNGLLFVFRLFNRVSYALVLDANQGVEAGDTFTQP